MGGRPLSVYGSLKDELCEYPKRSSLRLECKNYIIIDMKEQEKCLKRML